MTRPRSRASELVRLFDSAAQPAYALDEQGVIVFCNQACLDWLELPEESVLGQRCVYHSAETPAPGGVAAGLCPPPDVFRGQTAEALVASPRQSRRARFVPLVAGDGTAACVLAIIDVVESPLPPQVEEDDEPRPMQLHELLRAHHRQAAAWYRDDGLVGQSVAIRRVREQVEAASRSRASVLVVGPPGSGRRHVASTIHYGVADPSRALIPLDGELLSAELLHSTLRALASREAAGGQSPTTVLLCDADRLPAETQVELAGLLAAGRSSLRWMATAAGPLIELAARNNFRQDLAYALSTIVIELPPLCQRREDLPLLAQALLEAVNARSVKQVGGFSAECLSRFHAHPWPGNLDELAHVVEESHHRAEGAEIQVHDLPQQLKLTADALAYPRRNEEPIELDEFLGRVERELIRRALDRAKGNKAKAARLLGMTRPRLYRRMNELGLT